MNNYSLKFINFRKQEFTRPVTAQSLIQAEEIGKKMEKQSFGKMRFKNARITTVKSNG